MSRYEVRPLALPGCAVVSGPAPSDERGSFYKPFQRTEFLAAGLHADYPEQFFSRSARGVVRGLHLQLPPAQQWKLATCLLGEVADVLVDLRVGSPTYAQSALVLLVGDSGLAVLAPPGVAHGFQSLAKDTVMGYWVSSEHSAAVDTGIRWDSAGIDWPEPVTMVSSRDAQLPPLAEFVSPFSGTERA